MGAETHGWVSTCRDMARVERELAKAEQSASADLRRAAANARAALVQGDKRAFFIAIRDIDPPCSYLFDYSV